MSALARITTLEQISDQSPSETRNTKGLLALAAVLCVYSVPLAGELPAKGPNELIRIELAVAMALQGTIVIDEVMAVYGVSLDRAIRDGRAYSDKAPGVSLLSIPFVWVLNFALPRHGQSDLPDYWILRNALSWWLVVLPGALLPFILMRCYPALDPRDRIWFALVFALCTPLLIYSTMLISHIPAAAMIAAAYVLVLRPGAPDFRPRAAPSLLAGVLVGFAVATEYPTAIIGSVVFVTLILRRYAIRPLVAFLIGGVIGVAPALIYHHYAFESIWTTGYAFKGYSDHAAIIGQGFYGLALPTVEGMWGVLVSAKRGMFFYCPLLLLVPVGLVQMLKVQKRDAWPLITCLCLYLCFAAGFADWEAGWSAAARHLTPIVPLCLFPLSIAVQRTKQTTAARVIVVALAAISLCGVLLSIALTPRFPENFSAPLAQLAMRCLFDGAAAPNIISANLAVSAVVIFFLLAAVVIGATILALIRVYCTSPGAWWVPLTFLITITLYVGTSWLVTSPPTTDDEHQRAKVLARIGYPGLAEYLRNEVLGSYSAAGSHIQQGDGYMEMGFLAEAEKSYQAAEKLFEKLLNPEPDAPQINRGLALAHFKLASVSRVYGSLEQASPTQRIERWGEARLRLQRSQKILLAMERRGSLDLNDTGLTDKILSEIVECDAVIAELKRAAGNQ